MATYLVTGVAGFIGSNLAADLLASGERVRGVDNFSSGKRNNLTALHGLDLIEGTIADPEICRRACSGVDYVLHHAAIPSVPRSVAEPIETDRVNVHATVQLLAAARDASVKRFVFAGSSAAYGDSPAPKKREEMLPAPLSPYGAQKVACELYLRAFHRCYGLETVGLRYFNVFGPQQDPQSEYAAVIPKFITALLAGEAPPIFGDGQQTRDFVYIANVIHANRLACTAPGVAGHLFNVACGEPLDLNALVSILNELTGQQLAARHLPPRAGDIRDSLADISKARTMLGYEPVVPTREGLSRTVAWYKSRA